MTWQRIDETTFIDDTLVTCAEYQLFIDEMREQGKHYEPDHWTSHQVLAGLARAPILGVRHLDAVRFSEWLTKYEDGDCQYCLPTYKEATPYPMKSHGTGPLGYWIRENYQFAWVGSMPENARTLNPDLVSNHHLDRAFRRARAWSFDLTRASDLAHNLASNGASHLVVASGLANCLEDTLDRARDLYGTRQRDDALAQARHLAFVLARELDSAIDFVRERDFALDIYVEIFTLQQRIAGRSPAFEGIRLVRERIR